MALAADGSDDATQQMRAALDALAAVLLPHLREEEDEAMPITAAADHRGRVAGDREAAQPRRQVDVRARVRGSLAHRRRQRRRPRHRDRARATRPAVHPAARLRTAISATRGGVLDAKARSRPRRVQLENSVAVTVEADIDDVWDVVRDVTRVGEWSHECVGASWLGGSAAAGPRRTVSGPQPCRHLPLGTSVRDRVGRAVRARVAHRPHRHVPRQLRVAHRPRQHRRRHQDLTAVPRLRAPKVLSVLYALAIPAHRDRTTALTEDLQRLGTVASQARLLHGCRRP